MVPMLLRVGSGWVEGTECWLDNAREREPEYGHCHWRRRAFGGQSESQALEPSPVSPCGHMTWALAGIGCGLSLGSPSGEFVFEVLEKPHCKVCDVSSLLN